MKRLSSSIVALAICGAALAGFGPLASTTKFDGKFLWLKLANLPATAVKSLAHAKTIFVDVSFPKDVKLKKDSRGNAWFTFILADQGSDWKWHQTTKSGGVAEVNGVIKAGIYTISIPTDGLPKAVLGDAKQVISVGPGSSGVNGPASFSIERIRGR